MIAKMFERFASLTAHLAGHVIPRMNMNLLFKKYALMWVVASNYTSCFCMKPARLSNLLGIANKKKIIFCLNPSLEELTEQGSRILGRTREFGRYPIIYYFKYRYVIDQTMYGSR